MEGTKGRRKFGSLWNYQMRSSGFCEEKRTVSFISNLWCEWYNSHGHTKYGRSLVKKLEKETVENLRVCAVSFFTFYGFCFCLFEKRMYIHCIAGKNISIKIFDGDDATMKKRNTSLKKEKLIMISASAFVLTALTMSGVYMRRLNEETDESRIGTEHLATQELSEKVSEIAANEDAYKTARDMDADPDSWEVNTINVEALLDKGQKENHEQVEAVSEVASEESTEEVAAETGAKPAEVDFRFPMEQKLSWPMVGEIVMKYSMDKTVLFETLGQYRYNPAVIIGGTVGDGVKAPANSLVKEVGSNMEIGTYMVLNIGDGYEITLGQLENLNFKEGDAVEAGVVLGTLASPSIYYSAEGPSLFMKLTKDGESVDPMNFLAS